MEQSTSDSISYRGFSVYVTDTQSVKVTSFVAMSSTVQISTFDNCSCYCSLVKILAERSEL